MPDQTNFELTKEEEYSATNRQQLEMFMRMVDFINTRLSEIKTLQTDMTDAQSDITTAKADIDRLKNPPRR